MTDTGKQSIGMDSVEYRLFFEGPEGLTRLQIVDRLAVLIDGKGHAYASLSYDRETDQVDGARELFGNDPMGVYASARNLGATVTDDLAISFMSPEVAAQLVRNYPNLRVEKLCQ